MRRLAMVAALAAGCASLDQFDVPLDAGGTVGGQFGSIPGASQGFEGLAGAGATVGQTIENQGVKASDITSARLTEGTITLTAPAGGNLNWLRSFAIEVESPGVEKKRIAHRDDFTAKQQTYELTLDDVELKPYVAAESMTLAPTFVRASLPAQDQKLSIHLLLHVDLSVID